MLFMHESSSLTYYSRCPHDTVYLNWSLSLIHCKWNNKSAYCCKSCWICCSLVQILPAGTENDVAKILGTKGFGGLFLAGVSDNNHQTTWHREIGAWLWCHQQLLADIHLSHHTCQPSRHCGKTENPSA